MRKNIKDEFEQFKRNHYSVPMKNAVYIGLGLYYVVIIVFTLAATSIVKPFVSPPLESVRPPRDRRTDAAVRCQDL